MMKNTYMHISLVIVSVVLLGGFFLITNMPNIYSNLLLRGIGSLLVGRGLSGKLLQGVAVEAFVWSVLRILFIDIIAHISGAWYVDTIFSFRVIDYVPIEDIVRGFGYIFFSLLFYVRFFGNTKANSFSSHAIYGLVITIFLLLTSLILYSVDPNVLNIPYFYLWRHVFCGSIAFIGLLYMPSIRRGVFWYTLAFIIPFFVIEYFSLELRYRWFEHGNHIMYFDYVGHKVPLEEFLWAIVTVPAIAVLHEVFGYNTIQ